MEKKDLENFLNELIDLDQKITNEPDNIGFADELNSIVNRLSKSLQIEAEKKAGLVILKYINKSSNPNPEYATEGNCGFDLRANLEKGVIIDPGDRAIIPTGIYVEIEPGMEVQIRPLRSLAISNGITILNIPDTIDSDYRGEIMIILVNLGSSPFEIKNGEKIAQGVLCPVYGANRTTLTRVEKLSVANIGANGFESTGKL